MSLIYEIIFQEVKNMKKENDTDISKFTRYWLILGQIPLEPEKKTISQIKENLETNGIIVDTRTIQRDLIAISGSRLWSITYETIGKTNYWFFSKKSKLMSIPNMDIQTALAFRLVEKFTSKMMPKNVLNNINPHFESARENLAFKQEDFNNWVDKVHVITNTPLLAPKIDSEIIEKVYKSLLSGKMIEVKKYQKGNEEYQFTANPLGIVFRDYTMYLICTTSINDFEITEYKPLHRMKDIEVSKNTLTIPEDFNLDEYVKEELSWKISDDILNFEAEFDESIAFMLYETPLSEDQEIIELENGNIIVKAKLSNTYQLRWWLLNLGSNVKIKKPRSLYFEFKKIAQGLAKNYKV